MISRVFSAAWNTLATSASASRLLLSNDWECLCGFGCVGDVVEPLGGAAMAAGRVPDRRPTAMAFSCSAIAMSRARTCRSIYVGKY